MKEATHETSENRSKRSYTLILFSQCVSSLRQWSRSNCLWTTNVPNTMSRQSSCSHLRSKVTAYLPRLAKQLPPYGKMLEYKSASRGQESISSMIPPDSEFCSVHCQHAKRKDRLQALKNVLTIPAVTSIRSTASLLTTTFQMTKMYSDHESKPLVSLRPPSSFKTSPTGCST